MAKTLTYRRALFVTEYASDQDAVRAYRAAGFHANSDNVARVGAHRLLQDPLVLSALAKRINLNTTALTTQHLTPALVERASSLNLGKPKILTELASIAFASIGDVIDWSEDTVSVRPSTELTKDTLAAIKTVKIQRKRLVTGRADTKEEWDIEHIEVSMHDKKQPLELIGREFGMFAQKIIHTDETSEEFAALCESQGIPLDLAREMMKRLATQKVIDQ